MKAKDSVFAIKIEKDLRDAFMAAAEAADRSASQVVRELMRDYIKQQQNYCEYLQQKVDLARRLLDEGLGRPNADVEAEFATWRKTVASA